MWVIGKNSLRHFRHAFNRVLTNGMNTVYIESDDSPFERFKMMDNNPPLSAVRSQCIDLTRQKQNINKRCIMLFENVEFCLRDGRKCVLRSPNETDAASMLEYLRTICGETEFVLRYPDECESMTFEEERRFFSVINNSERDMMILAEAEGRIIGNCHIECKTLRKTRHRCSIAISVLEEFWSLGVGSHFMAEMIRHAGNMGCTRMELEYVEGNSRAKRMYEKFGFSEYGIRPDALHLKNGESVSEILMARNI